jgi:hypothetical protein
VLGSGWYKALRMTTRGTHAAIAIGVGALLGGLGGCNAVLGIEEAQVDNTVGALSCQLPDERPIDRCESTLECETCLRSCRAGEIRECIDAEDCRKGLVDHRVCVRDDCQDEDGRCTTCLAAKTGPGCLADCAPECAGGEIVSLVELFCTCMDTKCAGTLGGPVGECRTLHADTPDWELECLISHCELADTGAIHCQHSGEGAGRQCRTMVQVPDDCDASKGLEGYGCERNTDCCSTFCDDHVCRN